MSRHIPRTEDNKRISFPNSWTDSAPPIFGRFFEGWPNFFSSSSSSPSPTTKEERRHSIIQRPTNPISRVYDEESNSTISNIGPEHTNSIVDNIQPNRRRNSIHFGNQVNNLLEQDDVQTALQILQEDVQHIKLTEHDGTNKDISKIYSSIIKSLCDPKIQSLVSGIQKQNQSGNDNPIYDTVMWRLFTKVIESGYVLERDAHLCVVDALVESDNKTLALQAMYTLPREEWDTECYRVAILLHLMQKPKQIEEAQGLLNDYGKPYLEQVNPLAPTDLPSIRREMPWMKEHNISENDCFELWMFYQAALSDTEWGQRKALYEAQREESIEMLEKEKGRRQSLVQDWTNETFNIETAQQKVDKQSTDNDNTMIYIAMNSRQFEYGWQVYKAMNDGVNDSTPCIIMHLCWVAFCQIPLSEVSRRSEWETRAWSVYNRFMCSEFLHPEQPETPGFLHDILDIVANSPEKKARLTKAMSVYNLLVRLYFDSLLCDNRVIEPILCTLLSECCSGDAKDRKFVCNKAFEIIQRKEEIESIVNVSSKLTSMSFSMMWGYIILCLRSSDVTHFLHMIERVSQECRNNVPPASLVAPIQTFHNYYLCHDGSSCCYYFNYMFRNVKTTKQEEFTMIEMDEFGLITPPKIEEEQEEIQLPDGRRRKSIIAGEPITFVKQVLNKRTNIDEPQAPSLAMAVALGAAKGEELTQRMMYFTPNKAKVLIQHCLKVAKSMTA